MALHDSLTFDAALSGSVASALSGAPTDSTSADYNATVTNAVAFATAFDTANTGTNTKSDRDLLVLGIVAGLLGGRNFTTAVAAQTAAVAVAVYNEAKAQLQL
jgi:hypothetical protein